MLKTAFFALSLAALAVSTHAQIPPLKFFPQGGRPGQDLEVTAYLHHGGGAIPVDYQCGYATYIPHTGTDSFIRSWGEQRPIDVGGAGGVPVFAVLGGEAEVVKQGHCDECERQPNPVSSAKKWCCAYGPSCCNIHTGPKCCSNQEAHNRVKVDHNNGLITHYNHLRKDVMVQQNAEVYAGQQIGWTATSGAASSPHLHFGTVLKGAMGQTQPVDPFLGSCSGPTSLWANPVPAFAYDQFRFFSVGLTRTDLCSSVHYPEPRGPGGWIHQDEFQVTVYGEYVFPPEYVFPTPNNPRVRFNFYLISDGPATLLQSATTANDRLRKSFCQRINLGQTLAPGDYFIRVEIGTNPENMIAADLPLVVQAQAVPPANRPPVNPVSVSLIPAQPTTTDPLFCSVEMPDPTVQINDADYDIVSYRYVWTGYTDTGSQVLRDITHAGQGDALSCDLTTAGMTVQCVVTPLDRHPGGTASSMSASRFIGAAAPGTYCGKPPDSFQAPSRAAGHWFDLDETGGHNPVRLRGTGTPGAGETVTLEVEGAPPHSAVLWLFAESEADLDLGVRPLRRRPAPTTTMARIDHRGRAVMPLPIPADAVPGSELFVQAWILDPFAQHNHPIAETNVLAATLR